LPDIGPIVLEDAETGEQLLIDTHDKKFRHRFNESARRREQELLATFARAGVDVLSLSTEGDLAREVVRFTSLRKSQRKAPSASSSSRAAGRFPGPAGAVGAVR